MSDSAPTNPTPTNPAPEESASAVATLEPGPVSQWLNTQGFDHDVTQAPLQGARPTSTLRHDPRSLALAVMRFYRNHKREQLQ